jgi:hypothetical protein
MVRNPYSKSSPAPRRQDLPLSMQVTLPSPLEVERENPHGTGWVLLDSAYLGPHRAPWERYWARYQSNEGYWADYFHDNGSWGLGAN